MESLKEILDMNKKHPPGRRSTSIVDLCARVKELEKANKRLVDCAGAVIAAWCGSDTDTSYDQEMAGLAALLIEMENMK